LLAGVLGKIGFNWGIEN